MHGSARNVAAVTEVGIHHIVIFVVFRVGKGQVADHERIFNAYGMRDAVNGTTQRNDGRSVVIAIDAHDLVSRQRLLINADGGCVVFRVVGGQEDGVVDEYGIRVGQVPSILVGVSAALLRRTGDANHVKRSAPFGGEIGNHIVQIGVDLWPIRNAHRVLSHQQGALVQELHVHVDVVDAVVGEYGHLDVSVYAVKI